MKGILVLNVFYSLINLREVLRTKREKQISVYDLRGGIL